MNKKRRERNASQKNVKNNAYHQAESGTGTGGYLDRDDDSDEEANEQAYLQNKQKTKALKKALLPPIHPSASNSLSQQPSMYEDEFSPDLGRLHSPEKGSRKVTKKLAARIKADENSVHSPMRIPNPLVSHVGNTLGQLNINNSPVPNHGSMSSKDDSDSDEDEGIGWSPFAIPL